MRECNICTNFKCQERNGEVFIVEKKTEQAMRYYINYLEDCSTRRVRLKAQLEEIRRKKENNGI